MVIILLTVLASLAALAGGFVAIRSRKQMYAAMALTSGLVLGLVAFDLLPEVFSDTANSSIDAVWPMILFVAGFLSFHAIERYVAVHEVSGSAYQPHQHPSLGVARAVTLAGHSLVDGLSIGVAFQVSPEVGYTVALAVIGHRFADGFDTTSFMIFHGNKTRRIWQLLLLVVAMPIIGGLLSFVLPLPPAALTLYLGFFAGLLMYIAASNILPQAHTKIHPWTNLGLIAIGVAFMFAISRFI